MPVLPETFALTQQEAKAVQAEQYKRQVGMAHRGAGVWIMALAVPASFVVGLFAFDWLAFDGNAPAACFIGVAAAYLIGIYSMVVVMRVNVSRTKQRILQLTPQVWEQRTIELTDDGVRQVMDSASSLFFWKAISAVERHGEILFMWVSPVNAIVVPDRAFASMRDAESFEASVRARLA